MHDFVELKLSSALRRRLVTLAEAGVLGRTVDEVVRHFILEALHRDWLEQEVQRARIPLTAPPAPRPLDRPQSPELPLAPPPRAGKRLLRVREVCMRIGVGRTTVYAMVRVGSFPPPKRLGVRTVAWLESEVDSWIDSRVPGSDLVTPDLESSLGRRG